jgi:protein-S-isoprenylcysteine O-methyltransferase Ste14
MGAVAQSQPHRLNREPVKVRTLLATIGYFAVIAALLFAPAGTLAWPAAWGFLAIMLGASVVIEVMLLRHDPDLLAVRLGPPIQRGQKWWDKVWVSVFAVLFMAWLALIALDAVRFRWSEVPVWLQVVGAAAVVGCYFIAYLAFRENTFLAPVVKVQAERGQRVISTGPYARVRHPLYSGALLFLAGTPLLLGSWYGLGAAVVLIAGLALRAVLEERTLAAELDGYVAYADRVKYRLVPRVW